MKCLHGTVPNDDLGTWSPRMPFFSQFCNSKLSNKASLEMISISGILKQTSCNHLEKLIQKSLPITGCDLTTMHFQENVRPITTLDKQLTSPPTTIRKNPQPSEKSRPPAIMPRENHASIKVGDDADREVWFFGGRFSLMLTSLGCNG